MGSEFEAVMVLIVAICLWIGTEPPRSARRSPGSPNRVRERRS